MLLDTLIETGEACTLGWTQPETVWGVGKCEVQDRRQHQVSDVVLWWKGRTRFTLFPAVFTECQARRRVNGLGRNRLCL